MCGREEHEKEPGIHCVRMSVFIVTAFNLRLGIGQFGADELVKGFSF